MKNHTEAEPDLAGLCQKLVDMAGLVESAIANAILALVENNPLFARGIRAEDFRVHQVWLSLDRDCNEALLAYSGGDILTVRFITGVMKIGLDLKRMGDESKNIADRSAQLGDEAVIPQAEGIARMSEITQSMLNDAVEAFVNRDAREAKSLLLVNRQLLVLKSDTIQQIAAQLEQTPSLVKAGLQVALVARSLTRVGEYVVDMATNTVHLFGDREEELSEAGKE